MDGANETALQNIAIAQARMEEKLDTCLRTLPDHETRLRNLESHGTANHDIRITALERWKYALPASVFGNIMAAALIIWNQVQGK